MRYFVSLLLCLVVTSAFASNTFRDCEQCPEMVVIPAGTFLMGSPQDEPGRFTDERNHDEDDQVGPGGDQITVTVPSFALGIYEVTNREFARFIRQSGYDMPKGCVAWTQRDGNWFQHQPASWASTGRPYADDHPVSCVDWFTANAYVDWLSEESGKRYRLPSESEFEFARRAGSTAPYHFGWDPEGLCRYGNVLDASFAPVTKEKDTLECEDGYWDLAPVGQFEPNAFGIYDMDGNNWEWLADCYEKSYANVPIDGSPLLRHNCKARSIRGGSWGYDLSSLRSADRSDDPPGLLADGIGLRVARELEQ